MFKKIGNAIEDFLSPLKPMPVGSYQFQGTRQDQIPYRLNLRVEPDGSGILIINASTVLHLNRTAAEYAYHLVHATPLEQAAQAVSEKYKVSPQEAQQDFEDFLARIDTLIHTPDLDPVTFLDMERVEPYSQKLSAPYRLDCALTYQVSAKAARESAPTERVTRELSQVEWNAVLDKVAKAGIPHVVFTGGEPTLREDLPALIAKTEELGIVSGLLTDGLRFTDKTYLCTILNSGLDHIMLLCDKDEPRFWEALQNLMADDIAVTVHLTLTEQNKDSAVEVIRKLSAAGLQSLSLSVAHPSLDEVLLELQNKAIDLGLSMVWDLPVPYSQYNPIALEMKNGKKHKPKGAGKAWLYVEPDGDVLPAQGINKVMGNLLCDPWSSIWKKR